MLITENVDVDRADEQGIVIALKMKAGCSGSGHGWSLERRDAVGTWLLERDADRRDYTMCPKLRHSSHENAVRRYG